MFKTKSYNLDSTSKEFLSAVYDAGGRASTRQIREATGIESRPLHYRYTKLENQGLVEILKEKKAQNGTLMKEAVLTDEAIELIDEMGILDGVEVDSESDDECVDQVVRDYLSDAVFPRIRAINRDLLGVMRSLERADINLDDVDVSDEDLIVYLREAMDNEQR